MSRLRVAPIVEGHGEYNAVRTLLERVWCELLGGEFIEVIRPIRWPRSKLVKKDELIKVVKLAALKLQPVSADPCLILVLIDAETDAPCAKGPELLGYAQGARLDFDIACVLANVEYETWFVAAADSLRKYLKLPAPDELPEEPEQSRFGKAWVERHFHGNYSETIEQPAMTATMDLALCRERSPSFDKLCRDLERRLVRLPAAK